MCALVRLRLAPVVSCACPAGSRDDVGISSNPGAGKLETSHSVFHGRHLTRNNQGTDLSHPDTDTDTLVCLNYGPLLAGPKQEQLAPHLRVVSRLCPSSTPHRLELSTTSTIHVSTPPELSADYFLLSRFSPDNPRRHPYHCSTPPSIASSLARPPKPRPP